MVGTPGFTREQMREYVHEYYRQPHGRRGVWLAQQAFSRHQLARWRSMVFEGDLDRGLIPREGSAVVTPPGKRSEYERTRAAERVAHAAEVARLRDRVQELEATNDALGKAIGLLHVMSEHEPDDRPEPTDPSSSSKSRTS